MRYPRIDPAIQARYDQLKVFRPLEHDLTNYIEWCRHLCATCKKPHFHKKGKFRPCMAPFICGRCPKCREALKIKKMLVNQGRLW